MAQEEHFIDGRLYKSLPVAYNKESLANREKEVLESQHKNLVFKVIYSWDKNKYLIMMRNPK